MTFGFVDGEAIISTGATARRHLTLAIARRIVEFSALVYDPQADDMEEMDRAITLATEIITEGDLINAGLAARLHELQRNTIRQLELQVNPPGIPMTFTPVEVRALEDDANSWRNRPWYMRAFWRAWL